MIDNNKQKMGGTMLKPEKVGAAGSTVGAEHGYSPARGLR
jgi:hypothetical protein